jgi:hypothetical protein
MLGTDDAVLSSIAQRIPIRRVAAAEEVHQSLGDSLDYLAAYLWLGCIRNSLSGFATE